MYADHQTASWLKERERDMSFPSELGAPCEPVREVDGDVALEAKGLLQAWMSRQEDSGGRALGRSLGELARLPPWADVDRSNEPFPSCGRASSSSASGGHRSQDGLRMPQAGWRGPLHTTPAGKGAGASRAGDSAVDRAVERRLEALRQSAVAEEQPDATHTGDAAGLRDDVDVVLKLLSERRQRAPSAEVHHRPAEPAAQAAAAATAALGASSSRAGSCGSRTRLPPNADNPLVRMEARQQLLREKREQRQLQQEQQLELQQQEPPQLVQQGRRLDESRMDRDRAQGPARRRAASAPRAPTAVAGHQPARMQKGGATGSSAAEFATAAAATRSRSSSGVASVPRNHSARAGSRPSLAAEREASEEDARAAARLAAREQKLQEEADRRRALQRRNAVFRLLRVLEAARKRSDLLHRRAVVTQLKDARAAALGRLRLAVGVLQAVASLRYFRAWRTVASDAVIAREAEEFLRQRVLEQQQVCQADAHYAAHQCRLTWLRWRLYLRHCQEVRAAEELRLRAEAFARRPAAPPPDGQGEVNRASLPSEERPSSGQVSEAEACEEDGDASEHRWPAAPSEAAANDNSAEGCDVGCAPLPPPCHKVPAASQAPPRQRARSTGSKQLQAQPPELRTETRPDREQRRTRSSTTRQSAEEGQAEPPATPGPADSGTTDAVPDMPPSSAPQKRSCVVRPKLVVDMEKRAEERRKVAEDRKDRRRRLEEERQQAEAEAEEERQRQEAEEARQRALEKRERQRAEQLRQARRRVEIALLRQKGEQAYNFWAVHRMVDVWCALRSAALEAAERGLMAWRTYRRSLLRCCFDVLLFNRRWSSAAKEAASVAKERRVVRKAHAAVMREMWQEWLPRLQARLVRKRRREMYVEVAMERGLKLRLIRAWNAAAVALLQEKESRALAVYLPQLKRRALSWWKEGCEQSRLDQALSEHRKVLQSKVSGWLQQMDAEMMQGPTAQLLARIGG
eukprot:TRINITY_DN17591_c0_g1_i3.p1 TRINITY_DN17591_c0_g1~~TRINITY_DN17591_c0_g1_i3.p1  ORF type:complete len:994 (-),score=269.24 TRINITY_DN17591_c0_g1_i3:112-3030(-)